MINFLSMATYSFSNVFSVFFWVVSFEPVDNASFVFQASIMQGCSIVQLQNSQGLMVVPSQATIATSASPATQTTTSTASPLPSQGPPDTTQR
jgi:hypothetical protein